MVTGCLFIDSFQTDLIGRFYICIILSFILINVISAQSDWYLVFSSSFGFFLIYALFVVVVGLLMPMKFVGEKQKKNSFEILLFHCIYNERL